MVVAGKTAYALVPYAINKLQAAGYKLVSVAECLGRDRYWSVGNPAIRDVRFLFLSFRILLMCCVSQFIGPAGDLDMLIAGFFSLFLLCDMNGLMTSNCTYLICSRCLYLLDMVWTLREPPVQLK